MRYYHTDLKDICFEKASVVTLGNFDGLHLGHKTLLTKANELAKELNCQSIAFSFYPHPSFVLRGIEPVDLICTKEEKVELIRALGIDAYIEYPFTLEIARMKAIEFVEQILVNKLKVKGIVVGEDYRFGYKRQGDVQFLKSIAEEYGFRVHVISDIIIDENKISSSKIRALIKEGNLEEANEFLGRQFSFKGEVVKGRQLGRKLGFPTANISPDKNQVLPPYGVYISTVDLAGKLFYGVTSIGLNPTVTNDKIPVIETHIFDFNEEIYDQVVKVNLYQLIRPEKKFDSLEDLMEQMTKDATKAKDYFRQN